MLYIFLNILFMLNLNAEPKKKYDPKSFLKSELQADYKTQKIMEKPADFKKPGLNIKCKQVADTDKKDCAANDDECRKSQVDSGTQKESNSLQVAKSAASETFKNCEIQRDGVGKKTKLSVGFKQEEEESNPDSTQLNTTEPLNKTATPVIKLETKF